MAAAAAAEQLKNIQQMYPSHQLLQQLFAPQLLQQIVSEQQQRHLFLQQQHHQQQPHAVNDDCHYYCIARFLLNARLISVL